MHLMTVFAHPFADHYPGAVMDAFHQPFTAAGHSIDILDLHAEDFDPRFTRDDHAHFWGGPIPPEITAMHDRVEAADRLAFIYPVYWWGMPAMMKGWIERTFTEGWAYRYGSGVQDRGKQAVAASMLGNIPTTLIDIGGARAQTYDKYRYGAAMRTQIDVGTFAYCGITDMQSHMIYDVEGDHNAPNRDRGLTLAREIAADFLLPDRKVRNAKEDHLAMIAAGQ